jgi:predicted Na+-dependent transporter
MNIKRIFGAVLTILGVIGLIYAATLFVNKSGGQNVKALLTYGVIGFIFFLSGIGLVRTTKDES